LDTHQLFGHISGLHTNFPKYIVSPITCSEEVAMAVAAVMECQQAPYLVKYLGMPLAIRRLLSEADQPLVAGSQIGFPLGKPQ
jgi:hypothetical protein